MTGGLPVRLMPGSIDRMRRWRFQGCVERSEAIRRGGRHEVAEPHRARRALARGLGVGRDSVDLGGGRVGAPISPAEIRVEDLTVGYDGEPPVLSGVGGIFAPGSATAIVGPNGAGKSTLIKAIAGLLEPRHGRVRLSGPADETVAYLPQRADIDRGFPLACGDLVMLGLWRRVGAFRALSADERQRVLQALTTVGLASEERTPIRALSIGQFQRALFARVLLQDAPIVLLDEPFAAVDAETSRFLLSLIPGWVTQGRTVVAALHDLGQVRQHFSQTLSLDRRVVAWGPTETVLGAA